MMEEIIDFLGTIWNLRSVIIFLGVIVILFLCWDKIVGVIDHSRNVFKKGNKNDD